MCWTSNIFAGSHCQRTRNSIFRGWTEFSQFYVFVGGHNSRNSIFSWAARIHRVCIDIAVHGPVASNRKTQGQTPTPFLRGLSGPDGVAEPQPLRRAAGAAPGLRGGGALAARGRGASGRRGQLGGRPAAGLVWKARQSRGSALGGFLAALFAAVLLAPLHRTQCMYGRWT